MLQVDFTLAFLDPLLFDGTMFAQPRCRALLRRLRIEHSRLRWFLILRDLNTSILECFS